MRIGLITGEYPPMQGGVGAFTQALAQALAVQGHHLWIVTDRRARPASAEKSVRQLRDAIDVGYAQLYPRGRTWGWSDMALIADAALHFEWDVVNIQYQAAAYNMRLPAINALPWRLRGVCRTVVTYHDLRTPYLFPKAGRWRSWVVLSMARSADGVIVTNTADAAALRADPGFARRLAADPERLAQIPIGSNIPVHPASPADVAACRAGLNLPPDAILLGYFGFLNPSKGAEDLIAALADLEPHYHLAFIGGQTGASDPHTNQSYRAEIQSLIAARRLTERVHWTGFLTEAAVSHHLHACDLLVMPYRDGVSLRRGTLMAALAHGRPLITTRPAAPTPELEHGRNVWLTPPGDAAALSGAIRQLAGSPADAARLGQAAGELAQTFEWAAIARQTSQFLQARRQPDASPAS